MRRKTTI